MSQENAELTYQVYDAFNRRDSAAFLELMDADVEALPRLAAIEGGCHGHDGIRRWWQNLLDAIPDFTVEVIEVRELGDVTLTRMHTSGHGADSDSPLEETVWWPFSGVTRRSSGGEPSQLKPKPSKPWGCRSSRGEFRCPFR
jgi:ketosteroid isomerase-like protein